MHLNFLTEIYEKVEASGTDVISTQGIRVYTCIWNSKQLYLHKECFQSVACDLIV